ncbi:MAG: FHA domain-containing protein [Labilithrix sp.]|nr:FHA domain-containing protein [Labilithrix sp.]
MPVTVLVRSASQGDSPSLTFDGARVLIGRGSGCDVRLPDPSVSFRHATIRTSGGPREGDFVIIDEGSTNGTWVGGVRLVPQTPRLVKNGDLVRVGRVWLELEIGMRSATPDLNLATRDLAFALVERAMQAVGDDTVARVRVAEGDDLGVELRLLEEGRAYVIGRAETCDLPLADADASREHAIVTRRGANVLIRDRGSHNGVFLGDQRLEPDRDAVWRPATMVRIGITVLALDEPVTTALAALEAADDEQMQPGDEPAAPVREEPAAPPAQELETAQDPAPETAAPIAEIAVMEGPTSAGASAGGKKKKGWTVTDFLVVTIAVGVIGASIAGLVWVLR